MYSIAVGAGYIKALLLQFYFKGISSYTASAAIQRKLRKRKNIEHAAVRAYSVEHAVFDYAGTQSRLCFGPQGTEKRDGAAAVFYQAYLVLHMQY